MSPIEIVAIVAMTGYAIYKQTVISEVREQGRFKLALIYAIVGLCVGGFTLPKTTTAFVLLAISIGLSVVVGLARGRLTKVWLGPEGTALRQGTVVTIGLFLGLIAAKFALGTYEYLNDIRDTAGFGEIMVMIAVMVAVQAQIVWLRAQALRPADTRTGERV